MDASVVVTAVENSDSTQMAQLAVLFDEYRVHYGETADVTRSERWLREGGPLRTQGTPGPDGPGAVDAYAIRDSNPEPAD